METPIGDDEDSHLGDFIEDTTHDIPYRFCDRRSGLSEAIQEILATSDSTRSQEYYVCVLVLK